MKKLVLSLVITCALWQAAVAEEGSWLTDFAKAQAQAKSEKKLVLMDFNGSDWCPPCKALRTKVFSDPDFVKFASQNLVLVDVDFPRRKQQAEELKKANEALSERFKIEGFPTVIVLNGDGKELTKKVGYDGQSAKDFIAELEKLKK
jgi:thiol:disulfide interchange protein